jgi:hypothetical protein
MNGRKIDTGFMRGLQGDHTTHKQPRIDSCGCYSRDDFVSPWEDSALDGSLEPFVEPSRSALPRYLPKWDRRGKASN